MRRMLKQLASKVWDDKVILATTSHLAGGVGLSLLINGRPSQRRMGKALLGYCLATHVYAWLDKKSAKGKALPESSTTKMPLDATLALLKDPYRYISKQSDAIGSDVLESRLLLKKAIFLKGPEAAKLFYDERLFSRSGAMPSRIQKTLLGKGGVQGLDGKAHQHRKEMFMSLMTPARVSELGKYSAKFWESSAQKWANESSITLFDEVCELLTKAVCGWAGVPLQEEEVTLRTRELTAMFDYAGTIGPKHWLARLSRKHGESWIEQIITQVRAGQLIANQDTAAFAIAFHKDLNGNLLDLHTAAVELINVLRPTVAVSVFITQIAHALQTQPHTRSKLRRCEPELLESFVQEVRRYYPFFPVVAARVKEAFEWQGHNFPKGRLVIFDLFGTNHDSRAWESPMEFQAERFLHWDKSPYSFVPQGGGDHKINHRCPGEWIAIELMKVATQFLVDRISYDVPPQDLEVNFTRLPAIPRDRFIMENVCMKEDAGRQRIAKKAAE